MLKLARLSMGAMAALVIAIHPQDARCDADYAREQRLMQEIVPAIVVGNAVYLATARQPRVLAIYTDATPPARGGAAAIVVHGTGVHPDWGLIGALRTGIAEAGVATLSVQMPVLAIDAPRAQYEALFPESSERLAAAFAYLRERGFVRIAVVSHSLGASMADAYLASSPAMKASAWVAIGMTGAFAAPPAMPVLDVTAERDLPQVLSDATKRVPALPRDECSRHISISGTDHFMENRHKALVAAVVPFLERAFDGRC